MDSQEKTTGKLTAWVQLVRAPNLLTVPGDPIAGFMLALLGGVEGRPGRAAACAAASLCLYCAGLISNDYFDFKEDAIERPKRPLPSGLIKPGAALGMAIVLAALGVGFASVAGRWAFGVATVLTAAIVSYNAGAKKIPGVGCLNMGACRGLSLLLGAAGAGGRAGLTSHAAVSAAFGLTLYVAAVTAIAAKETNTVRIGAKRWLPAGVLVVCFVLLMFTRPAGGGFPVVGALFAVLAVAWALRCGMCLGGIPVPATVSAAIGRFLQGLLLIQAALCAQLPWAGVVTGAALACMWPALSVLARKFYQS